MDLLLQQPSHSSSPPNPHFFDDPDSSCSTPYVSAPSSPGRPGPGPFSGGGFFYSCPASPMHFTITSTTLPSSPDHTTASSFGYEFEFSGRVGPGPPGSMSSADELFLDGKIRPMKLSTHLEQPQVLAPLMDDDEENEDDGFGDVASFKRGRDLRAKSLRRRTRSLSPLRAASFQFDADVDDSCNNHNNTTSSSTTKVDQDDGEVKNDASSAPSASSSRSSSAGRNSKRWVFLKDFLYRSKSEGRSNNKFWSNISFSPAKDKKITVSSSNSGDGNIQEKEKEKVKGKKPMNGVGKRRVPTSSPHELHYKASRAQAEEMRKRTFLPYRQGLLGCLGFSSKSYGAMNGFARALNPVSSR